MWDNDHITFPKRQETHVSPFMFDPLMVAATAGAVTGEIEIGVQPTAPYYEPLWLANALASLDAPAGVRVTASFGGGGSQLEFDALRSSFADRRARCDEIIGILRRVWTEDFVEIETPHYSSRRSRSPQSPRICCPSGWQARASALTAVRSSTATVSTPTSSSTPPQTTSPRRWHSFAAIVPTPRFRSRSTPGTGTSPAR